MDKFLSNLPVQFNLSADIYLGGCNEAFSWDFSQYLPPDCVIHMDFIVRIQ